MKFAKALFAGILLTSTGWGAITSVGTFPAGSNGEVQFNKRNDFGASSDLTYSTTTKTLSAPIISFSTVVINGVTYYWPSSYGASGYTLNLGPSNTIVPTPPVSPVGGGGASTLAVNLEGVQVTSPTVALNATAPLIVVSLGGTTAQFSIDPSSVTMMGPLTSVSPIVITGGIFSLDTASVTMRGPDPTLGGALSGTISNAIVNPIDISAQTNLSAGTPLTLTGDVLGIDRSSFTLLGPSIDAAELPSDGYASTYVNTTGDTMTGQLTVTGSSITATGANGIRATYGISGGSLTARNLSNTLVAVDSNGVLVATTTNAGDVSFGSLTDVDDSGKTVNYVPKWNGTQIVWAAYNATFSFAVASFSDALSSTILIGTGTWKAAGSITFTATYTNGPSTGAYVSKSGWTNLDMTGAGYVGPTNSTEAVSYPSVTGTVVFTLNAGKGSETDTETITHTFYNYRFWGVSTTSGSYSEGHVEALAGSEISNAVAKTFTVSPGADEYIIYAYPSRLGTATFTVGGFEGGFEDPETVSVTNSSGYAEDYYIYRSTNKNLGSTTVTVS